jgi:hypothetical protein
MGWAGAPLRIECFWFDIFLMGPYGTAASGVEMKFHLKLTLVCQGSVINQVLLVVAYEASLTKTTPAPHVVRKTDDFDM